MHKCNTIYKHIEKIKFSKKSVTVHWNDFKMTKKKQTALCYPFIPKLTME